MINRPKVTNFDASIIKLDQFFSWYHEKMNEVTLKDTVGILKVCSGETVKNLGEKLLALHKPSRVDYIKKFELWSAVLSKTPIAPAHSDRKIDIDLTVPKSKEETRYFCANCKISIATVVAKYCWNNKSRFRGKAYCRVCQATM